MAEESTTWLRESMRKDAELAMDVDADPDARRRSRYNLISRLPRGARARKEAADKATQESALDKAGRYADNVAKVDRGVRAVSDWVTWVITEAQSGHFFGLFNGLPKA